MAFAIFVGGVIAGFILAALALGLNHAEVRLHLRAALHFIALAAADFKALLLLRAKALREGRRLPPSPEIPLPEAKTTIPAADLAGAQARATMKFDDFLALVPLRMPVIESGNESEASMTAAEIFKNPLVMKDPPPAAEPAPQPQFFNSCGAPIWTPPPLKEDAAADAARTRFADRVSAWIESLKQRQPAHFIGLLKEPAHRKALLVGAAALLIAFSFILGFHKAQRSFAKSRAVAAYASAYDSTPIISQNPYLKVAAVEDVSGSGPADISEPGAEKSKPAAPAQRRRARGTRKVSHARPVRRSHHKEVQSARMTAGVPVYSDRR